MDSEAMASALEATGDYRVLRKVQGPRTIRPAHGAPTKTGVFVDVENSTPEPDGTFKRYCLMVPPTTRTCTEGVAWTFGLSPTEYVLAAQT